MKSRSAISQKIFKKKVWDHYKKNKRAFPWRETKDPYRIVVSEIMLQQTQADRVVAKYNSFLKKWPTLKKLASAELRDVLAEWSGLGYNRRGKNLWLLAKAVVSEHKAAIPNTPEALEKLPGIGPYTARAILAFAFDKPYACIETNIRAVYIYEFFPAKKTAKIADNKLFPLIEETLDTKNPREWYYALMDYGSYLKKMKLSTNDRHKSFTKQSTFKGSIREARGAIMRVLIESHSTLSKLKEKIKLPPERIEVALAAMEKEGIVAKKQKTPKKDATYSISA
ncbi:MAG TPA: A/G-specific adenine glycosylase [Candidatus Paceibacterota bacterium]|nr:A/G-specific adenine glycosylase [Candidatus Paceibacterota bacterium]